MTLCIKFLSFGSKIDTAILVRCQWSPTTEKSFTSAVMSLPSWSRSNSSILAWNSSSEFKIWLSLDKTFLSCQATYLPRGTNGFFVDEWIALDSTCAGGSCVFNLSATARLPLSFRISICRGVVLSWAPGSLHGRSRISPYGLRHAQRIDVMQSDFVVSLSLPNVFMKGRYIAQFHQCKARVSVTRGSLSVRGHSSVWVPTVWVQVRFGWRVFLGASVFGVSLSRSLLYTAFQVLGNNRMTGFTSGSCDVLQGTGRLFIMFANTSLSYSGRVLPSISTYSQCREWLG